MTRGRARLWAAIGSAAAIGLLCIGLIGRAPWWLLMLLAVNAFATVVLSGLALAYVRAAKVGEP